MTGYTTDPAAELAALKVLEKAETSAWPTMPDDPAKPKKKTEKWPGAGHDGKVKKPRRVAHAWVAPELQSSRPFVQGGYTLGEVVRAALFWGAILAAAVLID